MLTFKAVWILGRQMWKAVSFYTEKRNSEKSETSRKKDISLKYAPHTIESVYRRRKEE